MLYIKKRIFLFLIALLICLYSCDTSDQHNSQSIESAENSELVSDTEVHENPTHTVNDKSEGWLKGEIIAGKGFEESVLAAENIELKHAMSIANAIREYVDFRYILAGEPFIYRFAKDASVVEEFRYMPDIVTTYTLVWDYTLLEYTVEETILPVEYRYRLVEGRIFTTLNDSLTKRRDVNDYVRNIVNNVLECTVSFRRYARKGDSYKVLLREKFYKGTFVPGTRVMYASYEGRKAGFHEAFWYEEEDKSSAFNAHYTESGKALLSASLRTPLDRIHVTSGFGMRRHPVTGSRRFHNGVDYRGRTGDPVYAVAKGKVTKVSRDKVSGKFIEIRHADGTHTYYLHLSSIWVKRGNVVHARERIGSVGSTGRVTGSHLHFGIKSPSGKWVDPLMKKMIATTVLKHERKKKLDQEIIAIRETLKAVEQELFTKREKALEAIFEDYTQNYPSAEKPRIPEFLDFCKGY